MPGPLLRGLGMSFLNLSISMELKHSCFKCTATSWLRFGAIHTMLQGGFGCELHWSKFNLRCVQHHNSSHPRFHADLLSHGYSDVQGNYISNCQAMVTEPWGGEKNLEILEEEMGEESFSENYPASPSSSSSPQPAQPSTDQPISSVLQSSHDIGSKTRKRANLVHPDILENAALEKFDGVDKHVSKKLQVDRLSQVSSALSTTRHQEFVSAHNEAVKKLQDEAEKPKELFFSGVEAQGFRRIFIFLYSFIVILVVLLAFFILSIFMVRCAY